MLKRMSTGGKTTTNTSKKPRRKRSMNLTPKSLKEIKKHLWELHNSGTWLHNSEKRKKSLRNTWSKSDASKIFKHAKLGTPRNSCRLWEPSTNNSGDRWGPLSSETWLDLMMDEWNFQYNEKDTPLPWRKVTNRKCLSSFSDDRAILKRWQKIGMQLVS